MENDYKCRLCLEESTRNINIFKEEDFSKMIELLTGLKVEPKDGLPINSCLQCHKEVKSAMLTRYQIINSYKILINEQKVPTNGSRESFDFGYNKNHINANTNTLDEIAEFVEADINNLDHIKDRKASHLVIHKSHELLPQFSTDNKELLVQKDNKIKNEDSSNDCCNSVEDSGEENEKFNAPTSKRKVSFHKKKVKDAETNPTESEKQEFDKILMKLRSKRNIANQEIRFKRKGGYRETSLKKKIHFKKKSPSDPHHVKVDYDIKPEHIEFLKTVGKKDRVACPICQREMYGMNMKNHLITHNFDPVICDTCGKTSKNAQALQDHINYYHKTTPDRFMCDKCGKGYRVRFMLERHEKKEHGNGEKDFECTVCGKKFFEKLQLKNHINITHNKIKPFKCEHCGKDFGRRTQFVTHQLVHTKENRYHCQVCGKGFKIKQTMQTHLKGVHGIEEEKTIFCKICQKGFSTAQGLRAHVNSRVHGLEKCEHCSEFITLEYKDVHLKEIHGIDAKNVYS